MKLRIRDPFRPDFAVGTLVSTKDGLEGRVVKMNHRDKSAVIRITADMKDRKYPWNQLKFKSSSK